MTRTEALTGLALVLSLAAGWALPGLAPVGLAPVPASAAPAATALSITADHLTADAATGIVVATGHVRVTDGRTVATGDRLVVDTRQGTARLTPGVVTSPEGRLAGGQIILRFTPSRVTHVTARTDARLALPRGTLEAGEIAIVVGEDAITAAGGVRVTAPPDLRASGARLAYTRRTGRFTLTGTVRLENRYGAVTGDRLEGTDDLQQATLRGHVRGRFADITAEADEAAFVAAEQKVVLVGNVRVRQGRQELFGTRVTIFYVQRRIVAEGPTRLQLTQEPAAP